MQVEVKASIAASPEQVWPVLVDVERWPQWTSTMTSVERLEAGPFAVGSRARVRQPRLPPMVWRVTDLTENRGFIWDTRNWGAHTIAEHWITSIAGGSEVVLRVRQSGLLVPLLAPWMSEFTRRYMEIEAHGLKKRCESAA